MASFLASGREVITMGYGRRPGLSAAGLPRLWLRFWALLPRHICHPLHSFSWPRSSSTAWSWVLPSSARVAGRRDRFWKRQRSARLLRKRPKQTTIPSGHTKQRSPAPPSDPSQDDSGEQQHANTRHKETGHIEPASATRLRLRRGRRRDCCLRRRRGRGGRRCGWGRDRSER